MPSEFKSISVADVAIAGETIYTAPASTQVVVIGFHIANKHNNTVNVDVGKSGVVLGDNLPIPIGSTLSPFAGKLVLEATETITVTPDVDAVVDVSLDILELT